MESGSRIPEKSPGAAATGVSGFIGYAGCVLSQETPPILERLGDAYERQNPESACSVAHSLKSSSAYLGATHLAAMCIKIESMVWSKALGSVREMLPEVSDEFESVRQELLSEL